MNFSRRDWVATIGIVLLGSMLIAGALSGLLQVSEISSAAAYVLLGGIATCAGIIVAPRLLRKDDLERGLEHEPTVPSFTELMNHMKPSEQREKAARPIINIYDSNVTAQPLQIRHKHRVATVDARLLVVKVGSLQNAAFRLKVAGATTPEMSDDALVSFGWLLRRNRFISEIPVTVPARENDALVEISASIAENVLQSECDLPPEIAYAVVVGFSLKDASSLCFGDCLIDLPYKGRVHITAYNETCGVLAERWFELDAHSWDDIQFRSELFPTGLT